MRLDNFLNEFLKELVDEKGIETIKTTIKEQMCLNFKDYDTTKVECQIFTENSNYDPRVEFSSDRYEDGEVVFIDYYKD
ncbi:MAG: hypothetical protein ACLR02_09695 [Clostridium sp.]